MFADDVTASEGGEAYGAAIAGAGCAFAAVDCILGEVSIQGVCQDLAHAYGRARRGVDFVPVVDFEHLYVHVIAKRSGCNFDEPETHVHTDAHIRCLQDSNVGCRSVDQGLTGGIEAGRADDDLFRTFATGVQGMQRGLWHAEINQDIKLRQGG